MGHPVNVVFIGSCTNSRISDLRAAAAVFKGRKVSPNVRVMVVPGSQQVKEQAQAEGLDKIFRDAGADFREAGCSMCIAMNGDQLQPGEYSVSTSNRNFEGRQGKGGRTFLASPLTAAASRDHRRDYRREDTLMKFEKLESKTVVLPIDNIDTDQIIPARFLKTISKDGLGDQLFYDWRYDADGSPKPDFVLEQAGSQGRADAGGRRQFRLRQLARACAVGADAVRIPGRDQHFLRGHLQRQFAEERPVADRGAGRCSRRS